MPFYGTLDSLLAYAPDSLPDQAPVSSGVSPLENILTQKVRTLADVLRQIREEMRSRALLTEYLIYRIDYEYCLARSRLHELYIWPLAASRAIENRRSNIERELLELNVERRRQQVDAWRDVAVLQKEFRTWLKQYADLMQRVRLVVPGVKPRSEPRPRHSVG